MFISAIIILNYKSVFIQDVDECADDMNLCRENAICVNTPGSYYCECPTGYRLTQNLFACEGEKSFIFVLFCVANILHIILPCVVVIWWSCFTTQYTQSRSWNCAYTVQTVCVCDDQEMYVMIKALVTLCRLAMAVQLQKSNFHSFV